MSVIKEFWLGKLYPQEIPTSKISEMNRLLNVIENKETALTDILDEKQNKKFEDYRETIEKFIAESETEAFEKGFKLCAKFMMECLKDE